MNKTRIILAATGGVIALAVLAMAILTWLAYADRTAAFEGGDDGDGLEQVVGKVVSLMGKKPFPSVENKKQLVANRQAFEDWCASARREAAKGDWMPDATCTPAQFKEQIAKDVKAIALLVHQEPDGSSHPIVAADFTYGPFKEYLADKMPSKEQLARLQRQWFDITSLIYLLPTNGVSQVTDIQVVDRAALAAAAAKPEADAKAGKKKKKKAAKAAKGAASDANQPSVETYRIAFKTRPETLVKVLGDLSFQDRFTVVDNFSFVHDHDAIAEAIGGGEKKEAAAAPSGRRGRRRGRAAEAQENETNESGEEKKKSCVFDPEKDSWLKAELTVSVYDFRSLEDEAEPAAPEAPAKKGAKK